jgi:hypothetical protein
MLDKDLRAKLCGFMSVDSLFMCRELNRDWKKTVDSFMLNTLVSRIGIVSLFSDHVKLCDLCYDRYWRQDLEYRNGPSMDGRKWIIKKYLCCKECEKKQLIQEYNPDLSFKK